jgi:broad specificity phosphatase PhoE
MSQTLIFLRHGKTQLTRDPSDSEKVLPIAEWGLAPEGEAQAIHFANEAEFQDVDVIIASTETKAFQTVKHLADKLGKEVVREHEIRELQRGEGFMGKEAYDRAAKECLEHPDVAAADGKWEKALDALNRFEKAIEKIKMNPAYDGKKILIVGHAYTMNLYFAKLRGELDKVYERYERNDFGDWGKIVDGEITKDLDPGLGRVGERLV